MGGWSSSPSSGGSSSNRTGPETVTTADATGLAVTYVGPSSKAIIIAGNSQFRPGAILIGTNFASGQGVAFSPQADGNGANVGITGSEILGASTVKIGWCASNPLTSVDTCFTKVTTGVVKLSDNSTGAGVLVTQGVAVAGLPSAATAGSGARGFVTDATTPTWGATVTGGGSTKVPVYSDGTNWKVG